MTGHRINWQLIRPYQELKMTHCQDFTLRSSLPDDRHHRSTIFLCPLPLPQASCIDLPQKCSHVCPSPAPPCISPLRCDPRLIRKRILFLHSCVRPAVTCCVQEDAGTSDRDRTWSSPRLAASACPPGAWGSPWCWLTGDHTQQIPVRPVVPKPSESPG